MKEILSKKKKLEDYEKVALIEECSMILQKKLPPKLKDPGSFNIPCSIGGLVETNALCDLGANVNLMPLSIIRKLNLGEARPTTVSLQTADRSVNYPCAVIEDVLGKVEKLGKKNGNFRKRGQGDIDAFVGLKKKQQKVAWWLMEKVG
ncbi:uncharacterized protein LOC133799635 [Humulus lupulus]|uniref:uncharacterized protein LOC133799635 n=1 Tax=Humulus lupulus TaxID=3486 RepID=UPI002B4143E0|nr:uncharacterized protein LOC133799635 [Humulus lupulus]